MITYSKYQLSEWSVVRNYSFSRVCAETGKRIWPLQKMYRGLSTMTYPRIVNYLSPESYTFLILKGEL